MGGKVKCSYEECPKRFESEDKMKRHKEKDPDHFYCKRCDVDCEDDTDFLIHQITSFKHLACPKCGQEFKSGSARDLHVRDRHREKQALQCVGCGETLNGAAAYMSHIAKGECQVITLERFDEYRAERDLTQDVWKQAIEADNPQHREFSRLSSDPDTNGGTPLLDDNPPSFTSPSDPASPSGKMAMQPNGGPAQQSINEAMSSMAGLSLDRYPPLPLQPRVLAPTTPSQQSAANDNLIEFDDSAVSKKPSAWNDVKTSSNRLFPSREEKSYPSQSDISGMPSDTVRTSLTGATYGNDTMLRGSRPAPAASISRQPAIPAAGPIPDNDPNAAYRSIQTIERPNLPSILDPMNFYDDIQCKFICPGKSCEQRGFNTPDDFKAHLRTGAHVGGKTQCPSCLRKFANTPALIAHCETATRKCKISRSQNYNQVLRDLTAGLLGTHGHIGHENEVKYVANPVSEWNDDVHAQAERTQW